MEFILIEQGPYRIALDRIDAYRIKPYRVDPHGIGAYKIPLDPYSIESL